MPICLSISFEPTDTLSLNLLESSKYMILLYTWTMLFHNNNNNNNNTPALSTPTYLNSPHPDVAAKFWSTK